MVFSTWMASPQVMFCPGPLSQVRRFAVSPMSLARTMNIFDPAVDPHTWPAVTPLQVRETQEF
jgi:hypothetical protein